MIVCVIVIQRDMMNISVSTQADVNRILGVLLVAIVILTTVVAILMFPKDYVSGTKRLTKYVLNAVIFSTNSRFCMAPDLTIN